MASNSDENTPASLILANFEKLANRAKASSHGPNFQRLTLNHRVLAELQADLYRRGAVQGGVSDPELLMLKRGWVFNWASLQSSTDFFRWSRASAAQELADRAHQAAEANSLLVAIMALRSILEVSGNAVLLERDLKQLAEPEEADLARMDWLSAVEALLDGRIAGVRVDYSTLTRQGLRGSKKFSYQAGEFADHEAKDLLKGVDVLDKRVKGARAAYEFFSEFAHPNLASVWTHYDRTEVRIRVLDIHGYAAHHQRGKVGEVFLETFGSLLAEGIEITEECVGELLRVDLALKAEGERIAKHAKKAIREVVRRDPSAFDAREPCPCNSGRNIQQCCGKLIKPSKFGKWTTVAPLH
jgi:hypothetical protein